jgi:WD40 repeat protein
MWDVSNKNRKLLRELQGHLDDINSVAFSPDGNQLVSGSYDKTVRLWNVANGKLLAMLDKSLSSITSVSFHPNAKQVAFCAHDFTVGVWTTCEWSDRVNHLFNGDFRRVVFCLMCVKARLELSDTPTTLLSCLPMALWLDIISIYYSIHEC